MGLLDVTDAKGNWRLFYCTNANGYFLTNRKTNETRILDGPPNDHDVSHGTENQFIRQCKVAFETGSWPA